MKKKNSFLICVMVLLALSLFGCGADSKHTTVDEAYNPYFAQLAYKSDKTVFDIDDVTLEFFYGSGYAGTKKAKDAPITVYLYFSKEDAETFPTIEEIESNKDYYVCGIYENVGEDAYYTKNTLIRINAQDDKPEWEVWGNGSPLYCYLEHCVNSVKIPVVSSMYRIPPELFVKEEGFVWFMLSAIATESFGEKGFFSRESGQYVEHARLPIHYRKTGDKIELYVPDSLLY